MNFDFLLCLLSDCLFRTSKNAEENEHMTKKKTTISKNLGIPSKISLAVNVVEYWNQTIQLALIGHADTLGLKKIRKAHAFLVG